MALIACGGVDEPVDPRSSTDCLTMVDFVDAEKARVANAAIRLYMSFFILWSVAASEKRRAHDCHTADTSYC